MHIEIYIKLYIEINNSIISLYDTPIWHALCPGLRERLVSDGLLIQFMQIFMSVSKQLFIRLASSRQNTVALLSFWSCLLHKRHTGFSLGYVYLYINFNIYIHTYVCEAVNIFLHICLC